MEKADVLKRNKSNKLFLLLIKYSLHIIGLLYAIYTLFGFIGIDLVLIGNIAHVSLIPWICLYGISKKLKYCYVHRLPLYYVAINEIIINIDTYVLIPLSTLNLFIVHSLILVLFIFMYSIYYIKNNVKNNKKSIIVDN